MALRLEAIFRASVRITSGFTPHISDAFSGVYSASRSFSSSIAAAPLQIGLPQEATVVQTHQQRQVRLVADELPVVDPLFDDHLGHAQAQGGVGGGLDGHVVVVVDGGGAAIGGYQHYFSPLVPPP